MQAVLLAAGFSSRMGELKQVIPIDGKPMVRYTAESLFAAGMEICIVFGHECKTVQCALKNLKYEYAVNPHPENGMFSSVKIGCNMVQRGSGCLIMPCDCVGVLPETIRHVAEVLRQQPNKIVIPFFQGKRGHPCGLPALIVERIQLLPDETPGLRSLWQDTPENIVHIAVKDPAILHDIDTPKDMQLYRN